ncbi:MAG TPA: type II secretion system protein [Candidatus Gracilibacteria bacterium]|nr:type II secretion system protein [Candidatus Gracilibacteria bacterium]
MSRIQKQKRLPSPPATCSHGSHAARAGFTLAELLIVITLIVLLMAAALRGMVNSQRTFIFNGASQQVSSLVREARSLAVTGKAQQDYTDYDQDGCFDGVINSHTDPACPSEPDYVTPAHYGIFFNSADGTATLFADLHGSGIEGVYNPPVPATTPIGTFIAGYDLKLAIYTLPPSLDYILDPAATTTIMYSPIFADTDFDADLGISDEFFVFGVKETEGTALSKRCFAIHPVAGVAETTDATGTTSLCI